jgi:hypothetical protein
MAGAALLAYRGATLNDAVRLRTAEVSADEYRVQPMSALLRISVMSNVRTRFMPNGHFDVERRRTERAERTDVDGLVSLGGHLLTGW